MADYRRGAERTPRRKTTQDDPSHMTTVTIRVPPTWIPELKRLADARALPMSTWIRSALKALIERQMALPGA